jgi:hypothetical protein
MHPLQPLLSTAVVVPAKVINVAAVILTPLSLVMGKFGSVQFITSFA